jgi:hypothetical protein
MEIIYLKQSSEVVKFAVNELKKYLHKMTDEPLSVKSYVEFPENHNRSIFIHDPQLLEGDVKYNPLDDEIMIAQRDKSCIITGSNDRSVLLRFILYWRRWAQSG